MGMGGTSSVGMRSPYSGGQSFMPRFSNPGYTARGPGAVPTSYGQSAGYQPNPTMGRQMTPAMPSGFGPPSLQMGRNSTGIGLPAPEMQPGTLNYPGQATGGVSNAYIDPSGQQQWGFPQGNVPQVPQGQLFGPRNMISKPGQGMPFTPQPAVDQGLYGGAGMSASGLTGGVAGGTPTSFWGTAGGTPGGAAAPTNPWNPMGGGTNGAAPGARADAGTTAGNYVNDFLRSQAGAGRDFSIFDQGLAQQNGWGFDPNTGAWNGPIPDEFKNVRRGDGFTGIRPGSGVFTVNGQDAFGSEAAGGAGYGMLTPQNIFDPQVAYRARTYGFGGFAK